MTDTTKPDTRRLMDKDKLLAILAEFFRDAADDDPDGVEDWFAQGDDDIGDFLAALAAHVPHKPHTR